MVKGLVGALLLATSVVAVAAAPSAASPAVVATNATTTLSGTAKPHLIKYKIYWGRCKDTCRVKVRITNISRQTLYSVSLNARLKINGKKAGSCFDYVGTIRAKHSRWGGCTVRSRTLSTLWNRWLDGDIRFDRDVSTVVHYEYYR
ncbi:hypothetical protein ACQP2T_13165 [Nonomuraea sp. CA-143628]|uniref:hypothetical protein n=1 Tax=Nonomuraea sp. CA-143628 TaxID=3239997 RepID=UPI003D925C82